MRVSPAHAQDRPYRPRDLALKLTQFRDEGETFVPPMERPGGSVNSRILAMVGRCAGRLVVLYAPVEGK